MATNRPYIRLSDIPKNKHPFTVPDNYFEQLPEQIDARIHPHDELDVPFATPPESTFDIPDGYFNDLAANIQKKTQAIELEAAVPTQKNQHKLWIITGSMAAALALLFAFSGIFKKNTINDCADPLACLEVTEAEFNSYIESEAILDEELINEYEIIENALSSDETIPLDDFVEETLPSSIVKNENIGVESETSVKIPSEFDFDFELTEDDLETFDYDFETL